MEFHPDQFAFDALGVVVTLGLGFLVWTLAHLFLETHPDRESMTGHLFRTSRPRR